MKRIITYFTLAITILSFGTMSRAEEGMWIPLLIERYNIADLQAAGCRLSAEDIYSINRDCLTDAVVIFGRGCTGEVISSEGLVLTNHHCGYGAIQSHSSVENDYLTNGYWAMDRDEELPNQGLSVSFLRYIEDVTEEILNGLESDMEEDQKELVIRRNISKVSGKVEEGHGSRVEIKPFYYGNEYYMFVYDVYRDIRLVGAPPGAIGNFGEDSDNWMWPRHTGDFALFRIYADKDNQPADFSSENIPYKPKRHFEISLAGVKEGDFAMVLGYPGSTTEYLYSGAVRSMIETTLPQDIKLRTLRLDIMESYMNESDNVRIQYASKYRSISNYWKKWKGVVRGLERMNAVQRKLEEEAEFIRWMEADDLRILKYDKLMPGFRRVYGDLERYSVVMEYLDEAVSAVELFNEISRLRRLMSQGMEVETIGSELHAFFKDFHLPVDRDIFAALMKEYYNNVDSEFHPEFFSVIQKKYKGDFERFAEAIYAKSHLSSPEKAGKLLDKYAENEEKALKLLSKDAVLQLLFEFREIFMVKVYPENNTLNQELDKLYKSYMTALREMHSGTILYPDANFTMRLSYGKVEGYRPRDAVIYESHTTLAGLIEKTGEEREDYAISKRLEELYSLKEYGEYGINGTMPVCFAASNHTSNGSSGSPVLDADGRLIGVSFDRNWEGTMSDVMYDPDQCRNISVDIRYVLFIIDKFAGAGYLLEELSIVE